MIPLDRTFDFLSFFGARPGKNLVFFKPKIFWAFIFFMGYFASIKREIDFISSGGFTVSGTYGERDGMDDYVIC